MELYTLMIQHLYQQKKCEILMIFNILFQELLAAADFEIDYDDEVICTLPKALPGLSSSFGEEAADVSLFPNPAHGYDVQVRFPSNTYQHIEIVNTLGQVLKSDTISSDQQMYRIPSQVYESVPQSVLMVRLQGADGQTYTERLMLQ